MGDILQQLDSDNSFDNGMAEGSDDDLGMSLDTDYESEEGILPVMYHNKKINKANK